MRLQLLVKVILVMLGMTHADRIINVPITNMAVHSTVHVGVGNPPTMYDLLLDTGSANTWVGANKAYVVTSTSHQTADSVSARSGTVNLSGTEYIDEVTLAPGLVVLKQSIGVATSSTGMNDLNGILGLGPVAQTRGTLSPDTSSLIPTVTDNLFSDGTISENIIGISLVPATSASEQSGELTFGGVDNTKFTGAITWAPITTVHPANEHWSLDASFTYGSGTPILSQTAGIIDTGTTLLLLATDAYQSYQRATGGVLDQATSLLKITSDQYNALKPLHIHVNDQIFTLTPNAQIWPRSLNTNIGGDANSIYLIVGDIQSPSRSGLDFILGHSVLERFYSAYDTANQRVGLATTPFTDANTN